MLISSRISIVVFYIQLFSSITMRDRRRSHIVLLGWFLCVCVSIKKRYRTRKKVQIFRRCEENAHTREEGKIEKEMGVVLIIYNR